MVFLAHRYPRIRRHTAEQLYIKLVEDDGGKSFPYASNALESVMTLLSEFPWEMDSGPSGNFRESRNRVSDLLGIKLNEKERTGTQRNSTKVKEKIHDEFQSYASLIKAVDR